MSKPFYIWTTEDIESIAEARGIDLDSLSPEKLDSIFLLCEDWANNDDNLSDTICGIINDAIDEVMNPEEE